jgi:SAM-dependent methyltransferase
MSSGLDPEEMDRRAKSFGKSALQYEKFRPGPPVEAVDWMLQTRPSTVVDLGAGTGGLTRLLIDRADTVIAVEPDDQMREILAGTLPTVSALRGRGEEIPVPDSSADAVLASSSWHWMDPVKTLGEVARVLVPGGVLGAVWSGPDPDGPFVSQARDLLAGQSSGVDGSTADEDDADMANSVIDPNIPPPVLEIPADAPFVQPERQVLTWNVALNADELIGLLGTFSWIILMAEDQRQRVFAVARELLRDALGIEGDVTVDVQYRSDAWRTQLVD